MRMSNEGHMELNITAFCTNKAYSFSYRISAALAVRLKVFEDFPSTDCETGLNRGDS